MAFADIAQTMQNIGHTQSERRLAGTGIARKTHMQRRRLMREPHAFACVFNDQQRRDFAQPLFNGLQTDKLILQLVEDVGYTRGFIFGFKIHR